MFADFFWSVFSRIRTEYGNLQSKYPYSVQIRENTDHKNTQYRHFLRSKTHYIRSLFCLSKVND